MAKHELIQEIKRSEAQAYQVIFEIRQGLAFEEAARLYSSAPNAVNGGLLGWVPFGSSPRFDNAAFGLEPGEISSKPVEGKRGYQILKVEKKVKSTVKPYEVARDRIYARLHTEAADKLRYQKIEAITQEAKIELEPAASQFGRYFQDFWNRPNIYSVSN